MDVQLTDLNQQLFDVIISILTKISDIISKKIKIKIYFLHLVTLCQEDLRQF